MFILFASCYGKCKNEYLYVILFPKEKFPVAGSQGMNSLMAVGFVMSYFVLQGDNAILMLPVCPQTPLKARLLNI